MRSRLRAESWGAQPLRSFLFAPGSEERKLARLGSFGSDVIVLDLEDAVADGQKASARAKVRDALPSYEDSPVVLVRVNGEDSGLMAEDLSTVVSSTLDGVIIPKVEDPGTLFRVDRCVAEREAALHIPPGSVRLFALIETALGLARCEEIALSAPPRVVTLLFGIGDFTAELGVEPTADGDELSYARSRIVVAARAAGLRAPIDGPFLRDLSDVEDLVRDTRRGRRLGFHGRVVVYPPHVAPVQRAFSELSDNEVRRLRRIVKEFEAAERAGLASIRVEGRFIDYPPYQLAKQRLDLYEIMGH